MTELIINGIKAVLATDFSVTVKQENAFVTKNGEYTYDCTMSLLNPINANLYSFLQRINKKEAFATKRRIMLIADNRVYCDGTEVITKWTNEKVTIQIVSGNSQFNYFIGSDKKISELDLGSATVDETTVNKAVYDFESLGYAFPPFKIGDTSYNVYKVGEEDDGKAYIGNTMDTDYTWRAMPFLNTMMVKIITALGYTIKSNILTSSEYRFLILFHSQDTTKFAKMFPGWTCKEFLEEIEKLFNIVFYLNYKTKEVEIITQAKFYATAGMVHVKNVKEAYEMDIENSEDSENEEHTTCNIGYDLPDTTYYNYRRLPTAIVESAVKGNMLYNDFFQEACYHPNYITTITLNVDPSTGRKYIFYSRHSEEEAVTNGIIEVDQFSNLIQDNSKTNLDITLSIIPANLTDADIIGMNGKSLGVSYNMPVLDESSTTSSTVTPRSLYDRISNGNFNKEEESKSNIQAGIYSGPLRFAELMWVDDHWVAYPQVYTDGWVAFVMKNSKTKLLSASMNLQTIAKEFYIQGYDINRKHKLTIESYDVNIYDPRQIFEIKNKRYVCESIEYILDSKGRKGTWKGIFYPVEISDTDAEHLWILADGKWRDNGVFIDNGRWFDN